MTKKEFLSSLRSKLQGLPPSDIDERISFYSEMIDDRMDEGKSEEEAVSDSEHERVSAMFKEARKNLGLGGKK